MKTKILQNLKAIALGLILTLGMGYAGAQTFTGPACGPEGACNTPAPLNVGSSAQLKSGPLSLVNLFVSNLYVATSTGFSVGQVLTADTSGKASWQGAAANSCNSVSAPVNAQAQLSLLKNGVNMCTDAGGCEIKLTEINSSEWYSGSRMQSVAIHFQQLEQEQANLVTPQGTQSAVVANQWSTGPVSGFSSGSVNGDAGYSTIWSGWNGTISDDSVAEQSPDKITVNGAAYSRMMATVCDF
ncbi:MAG: hypothetical protein QG640_742 [Patescibacteria group bacterium]|nr:hypothetical protein [Patescibacteria group bacterium]